MLQFRCSASGDDQALKGGSKAKKQENRETGNQENRKSGNQKTGKRKDGKKMTQEKILSPCPGYGGGYPHKISEISYDFLSLGVIFHDFRKVFLRF